jgi:hypothetical protein
MVLPGGKTKGEKVLPERPVRTSVFAVDSCTVVYSSVTFSLSERSLFTRPCLGTDGGSYDSSL